MRWPRMEHPLLVQILVLFVIGYTTAPVTTKSMTPQPPQQRVILQQNVYKKCEGTAHASEDDDKGKEYIQMPFFS